MKDQVTVTVAPEMTTHDAPLADVFRRVSQLNKDEIEAIEIDIMSQAELWVVMAAKDESKGNEHGLEIALLKEEFAGLRRGKSIV
jgi:hypothetical protein